MIPVGRAAISFLASVATVGGIITATELAVSPSAAAEPIATVVPQQLGTPQSAGTRCNREGTQASTSAGSVVVCRPDEGGQLRWQFWE